jgi:hypothetical protein
VLSSSSTIDAHNRFLAPGLNTAYTMLSDTQRYVATVSYNQIRAPVVAWDPAMMTLTCDGKELEMELEMERFRSGIQALVAKTWELYDRITSGRRFANRLPDSFRDDLNNNTRGYSFLSHGPFTDPPNSFVEYLLQDSSWTLGSLVGGDMQWDESAIVSFDRLAMDRRIWGQP